MSDINVTFAGLPIHSPIAIEPTGNLLTPGTARSVAEAGVGAIFAPPIDPNRLAHRDDANEITENNQNDESRRESHRVVRRLNLESYLDEITQLSQTVDVPLIAPLSCDRNAEWFSVAEQLREAGATAVELRPSVEALARTQRSDAIEKSVLRITSSVAGRIDIPVLIRIPIDAYGLITFVQALGESDAAAVTIRPRSGFGTFDLNTPSITTDSATGIDREAAFHAQLSGCRSLYRRVNPHLGLQLPSDRPQAMAEAILAGATVGVLPVPGDDPIAATHAVDEFHTTLAGWMRQQRADSLFGLRGVLSESRMTSTLEN